MVQLQECLLDLLEGQGDQDANVDLMVQKVADVLQNQFDLKPKMQGQVYTPLFPEWYHRVALPHKVKPPGRFHKIFWAR
jgi:hypothetical protein